MESESMEPAPAVRAQLLATEHWGLLAARGTAQSEVLTRISIQLTLVSAGLVALGLLGQALRFGSAFGVAAVAVLVFLTLIGLMTHARVSNIAIQDMEYVIGMNRLRAGYVELDPGVERFFITASHDDEAGMRRTYAPILDEGDTHVFGSSFMLVFVVNAVLIGLLGATLSALLAAPPALTVALGAALGIAYLVVSLARGRRRYARVWSSYRPLRPQRH